MKLSEAHGEPVDAVGEAVGGDDGGIAAKRPIAVADQGLGDSRGDGREGSPAPCWLSRGTRA